MLNKKRKVQIKKLKKDVTKHQETTYASTVKDSIRGQMGTPDKGHD
ncbi:hypothetical protein OL548_12880 [Lysinibacillus sp. MHQ-1]|nr:hypothetical protein OL548_12880 [Lysinibacillus sp. MHQ-1]